VYSIRLIKVGAADVRGPEAFWMARWDEWVPLVFYIVLLRNGDKTVLVNTGPPDDLTDINRVWLSYLGDPRAALRVADHERMPDALQACGVSPAEVDTVVLSPFAAYATGGLHHFPNATIALSRHGWEHFIAPRRAGEDPTAERATRIPMSHLARMVTDWWPRVRLLEDEDEIAPGLTVFRTGVHDRGSLAVVATTRAGTVVYSDSAYHNENLERRHPMGIAYDLDEAYASYDRIDGVADLFLAGFDPGHLTRFPEGHVI
jgi:hypothetical protein